MRIGIPNSLFARVSTAAPPSRARQQPPLAHGSFRASSARYLEAVESKLLAVLQSIGVAFADLTVTAQGKLSLSADGTSAESVFHEDVVDTLANLLRDCVRAKAGVDRKIVLFRDDTRAALKTLERLEQALGIAEACS